MVHMIWTNFEINLKYKLILYKKVYHTRFFESQKFRSIFVNSQVKTSKFSNLKGKKFLRKISCFSIDFFTFKVYKNSKKPFLNKKYNQIFFSYLRLLVVETLFWLVVVKSLFWLLLVIKTLFRFFVVVESLRFVVVKSLGFLVVVESRFLLIVKTFRLVVVKSVWLLVVKTHFFCSRNFVKFFLFYSLDDFGSAPQWGENTHCFELKLTLSYFWREKIGKFIV